MLEGNGGEGRGVSDIDDRTIYSIILLLKVRGAGTYIGHQQRYYNTYSTVYLQYN